MLRQKKRHGMNWVAKFGNCTRCIYIICLNCPPLAQCLLWNMTAISQYAIPRTARVNRCRHSPMHPATAGDGFVDSPKKATNIEPTCGPSARRSDIWSTRSLAQTLKTYLHIALYSAHTCTALPESLISSVQLSSVPP